MALKMLVDPATGAILGAQGVGTEGVDKRIDVLATAIRTGLTAPELADLELAYAPPYSSAKDPVNMLGYVAENVLSGLVETAQWNEVDELRAAGAQFIDVRTAAEFREGSLPGAVNIPVDQLREHLSEVVGDNVIVFCQTGLRAHTAALLLVERGARVRNLDGGYQTWSVSPAAVGAQLVA
jgi:rhodanese-related sulfurtransferase